MKRPPTNQSARLGVTLLEIARGAITLPITLAKLAFHITRALWITATNSTARKFAKAVFDDAVRHDRRAWAKAGIDLERLSNEEFAHVVRCRLRGQIQPLPRKGRAQ